MLRGLQFFIFNFYFFSLKCVSGCIEFPIYLIVVTTKTWIATILTKMTPTIKQTISAPGEDRKGSVGYAIPATKMES